MGGDRWEMDGKGCQMQQNGKIMLQNGMNVRQWAGNATKQEQNAMKWGQNAAKHGLVNGTEISFVMDFFCIMIIRLLGLAELNCWKKKLEQECSIWYCSLDMDMETMQMNNKHNGMKSGEDLPENVNLRAVNKGETSGIAVYGRIGPNSENIFDWYGCVYEYWWNRAIRDEGDMNVHLFAVSWVTNISVLIGTFKMLPF